MLFYLKEQSPQRVYSWQNSSRTLHHNHLNQHWRGKPIIKFNSYVTFRKFLAQIHRRKISFPKGGMQNQGRTNSRLIFRAGTCRPVSLAKPYVVLFWINLKYRNSHFRDTNEHSFSGYSLKTGFPIKPSGMTRGVSVFPVILECLYRGYGFKYREYRFNIKILLKGGTF